MNKLSILVIMFFFTLFANAQAKIIIKGKLIDKENSTPIEEATVYITSVKDSTVIDYTISDKNGIFKFETKKITVPFFLKTSTVGYENYKIKENSCTENKDFGVLSLLKKKIMLNEVVVKSEAPPIKIKKDTLEFNASSFKVRPDANVETLLRQLPGVKIDANKKITINGKVVNKILVDGKPFFGEDGQIALQNLPADMIKKVQVSDTKTKEEEMTGQHSSSNSSTINLTLQEDKSKGFFGKIMSGYGTNNRYESSGIAGYFKDKRRITAIFSSNNINATGFSMDEVFDNMGGGRNGGPEVAMGAGINRTNMAGVNYDDQIAKKVDSHLSYKYDNSDQENNNKTSQVSFLTTGNIHSESESVINVLTENNTAYTQFGYKNDKKFQVSMVPFFFKQVSTTTNGLQSSSRDDNNQLLNESSSKSKTKNETDSFGNRLTAMKSFDKKNRYFSGTFFNSNERRDGNSLINSTTQFYQDATPNDLRNQNTLKNNLKDKYTLNLRYSEPVTDSTSVSLAIEGQYIKDNWGKSTFDFNEMHGGYTDKNELMSSNIRSLEKHFEPYVNYDVSKNKFYISARLGANIVKSNSGSDYLNATTSLDRNYVSPDMSFNMRYNFGKNSWVYMRYYNQVVTPTADQLLPVANLSNPLNTIIGNPNLDLVTSHLGTLSYSKFDNASRSEYSIYSNVTYNDSEIVTTSFYDENGKQTTTYTNVFGTYYVYSGANWNKTVKKNLHSFTYGLECNFVYNFKKGFTNSEMYSASSKSIIPEVNLSYNYSDLLTINPSYSFKYFDTDYDNYTINETSNSIHVAKVEITNYILKKWVFGNDFSYNYNSDISGGFQKDFYLWNTSLSYKSKGDQWIFKLKVYDILNQNQSDMRTITETSVVDSKNTVLKRYGMLSLTYKFQKFGKKLEVIESK
ncbi:hypothetical protein EM308_14630 [Flavobacterium gilvum]|uniref:Outer membrane protein beta-barrel domain-containing protein n=1 Tax=Flavobacterium gilvum TaxID=1492737 RepID=A0AAC9I904_9FLAO|nr:hypothetical protein EM308_14630 [Flavobacterium gilvum]